MWQGTHYSLKYITRNRTKSPYLLNRLAASNITITNCNAFHYHNELHWTFTLQRLQCSLHFETQHENSNCTCCRKVTSLFNTPFGNWKQFGVRGSAVVIALSSQLTDTTSSVYLTANPVSTLQLLGWNENFQSHTPLTSRSKGAWFYVVIITNSLNAAEGLFMRYSSFSNWSLQNANSQSCYS